VKELWKSLIFIEPRWPRPLPLTYFQGQRSLITFQLVLSLYDKYFTSFKFLHKNFNILRAIILSRIIEHAIQKRWIISLFRSYYTLISWMYSKRFSRLTDNKDFCPRTNNSVKGQSSFTLGDMWACLEKYYMIG
jgi:hypothetical protein